MRYRIISDRIMKHGVEIQYKHWGMWLYLTHNLRDRTTYYNLKDAVRVLDILKGVRS